MQWDHLFHLRALIYYGAAVESVPTVGVPPNVGLSVKTVGSCVVISSRTVGAGEGSIVAMKITEGAAVEGSRVAISVSVGEGVGSNV
ncbi:hypothetical protein ACHAXH_007021, partial [Discostella pseudostelligera]